MKQVVTSADTLTIPMSANGGCSVTIAPLDDSIQSIEIDSEYALEAGQSAELTAKVICDEDADDSINWVVSDSTIATVEGCTLVAKSAGIGGGGVDLPVIRNGEFITDDPHERSSSDGGVDDGGDRNGGVLPVSLLPSPM